MDQPQQQQARAPRSAPARSRNTSRRSTRTRLALAAGAVAALTACATVPSYQPFEGGDAARLRVRLLIPDDYRGLMQTYDFKSTVGMQSVKGNACSEPRWTPMLRIYRGPTRQPVVGPQAVPGAPPPPAPKYPRAGMAGSTEGENTESVELKVAPGLHVVNLSWLRHRGNGTGLLGALLTKNCPATNVALQLQPNAQYELAVGFKENECAFEVRRLEGNAFMPTKFVKEGGPAEICAGNQFAKL